MARTHTVLASDSMDHIQSGCSEHSGISVNQDADISKHTENHKQQDYGLGVLLWPAMKPVSSDMTWAKRIRSKGITCARGSSNQSTRNGFAPRSRTSHRTLNEHRASG